MKASQMVPVLVATLVIHGTVSFAAAPLRNAESTLTQCEQFLAMHEGTTEDRAALETLARSGLLEKLATQWRTRNEPSTAAAPSAPGYGSFEGFRHRFVTVCLQRDVEQVVNYCTLPLQGTEIFNQDFTPLKTATEFSAAFDRIFTREVVQILLNTSAQKQADGSVHLPCLLNSYDEDEGMVMESSIIFIFTPVRETYRLTEIMLVG